MNLDITALIPVKANSQRVKKKNLRNFADSNLYEIKLKQLQKTKCFKRIIVSSECMKVLNVANKYGFETHLRDKYYSTSEVPMSEVYSHIASQLQGKYIAWINVTNPICDKRIYKYAVKKFLENHKKYDCLLSAVMCKQNFFFKDKPINFYRSPWPRSQDLEPLISLPFAINILERKKMIQWGSCVGHKPFFLFINPLIATDIDDEESYILAETIYKNKNLIKKLYKKINT